MAVKKVGDDPGAVKRATCGRCGSILEYLPIDVASRVHHDYGGGSDTYYSIKCPQCQNNVDVDHPDC